MTLIESYISYNKFVLVNHMIGEHGAQKETTKNLKTLTVNQRF